MWTCAPTPSDTIWSHKRFASPRGQLVLHAATHLICSARKRVSNFLGNKPSTTARSSCRTSRLDPISAELVSCPEQISFAWRLSKRRLQRSKIGLGKIPLEIVRYFFFLFFRTEAIAIDDGSGYRSALQLNVHYVMEDSAWTELTATGENEYIEPTLARRYRSTKFETIKDPLLRRLSDVARCRRVFEFEAKACVFSWNTKFIFVFANMTIAYRCRKYWNWAVRKICPK